MRGPMTGCGRAGGSQGRRPVWQVDLALRLLQRTGASPRESHEKPGNGYEVSIAELDALVEIARSFARPSGFEPAYRLRLGPNRQSFVNPSCRKRQDEVDPNRIAC